MRREELLYDHENLFGVHAGLRARSARFSGASALFLIVGEPPGKSVVG